MPIQLIEENDGKVLIVRVGGNPTKMDYKRFLSKFARRMRQPGKRQVLFDITGLQGWHAIALWEEMKFDIKHLAGVERIAMVGDKTWQQSLAIFCQAFTRATVRYFDHSATAEARSWLGEGV
jgi:hypothetical protein